MTPKFLSSLLSNAATNPNNRNAELPPRMRHTSYPAMSPQEPPVTSHDSRCAHSPTLSPALHASVSSFQMPLWLLRAYRALHEKSVQTLSISLLTFRFLDPESPLWFLNANSQSSHTSTRHSHPHDFLLHLLNELIALCEPHCSWSPQQRENSSPLRSSLHTTIYLKHNTAILLFFAGQSTEALRLMDILTQTCSESPTLHLQQHFVMQSTVFIFIHLGMFYEASILLTHLLNQYSNASQSLSQQPRHIHSIYLSLRLLDEYLNCIYLDHEDDSLLVESSSSAQLTIYRLHNVTVAHLLAFRESAMMFVCNSKPKNHLYKLWLSHWMKQRRKLLTNLSETKQDTYDDWSNMFDLKQESFSKEDIIDNLLDFLSQISKLYAPERLERLGSSAEISHRDEPSVVKRALHRISRPNSLHGKIVHWLQGFFLHPKWSMFAGILSILCALLGFSYVVRAATAWMQSNHFPPHPSMTPMPLRRALPQMEGSVFSAPKEHAHVESSNHKQQRVDYSPAYTKEDEQDLKRGVSNLRVFTSAAADGHGSGDAKSAGREVEGEVLSEDFDYVNRLFQDIRSNLAVRRE